MLFGLDRLLPVIQQKLQIWALDLKLLISTLLNKWEVYKTKRGNMNKVKCYKTKIFKVSKPQMIPLNKIKLSR